MKLLYSLIFLLVIISCSLTRYSKDNFTGKVFEWGNSPSMLGKSSIKFINDSSFTYSERDSLFICTGNWYLSSDKKTISITGTDIPLKNNLNPPITVKINKDFTIISATKIRDEDRKLFETKR
jgi:hypothetical protein